MEALALVRLFGTLFCLFGLALAVALSRKRFDRLPENRPLSLGIATLSVAAFWKLVAPIALVAAPAAAVVVANYHTLVGVHHVEGCGGCHVMRPMVTDLRDPESDTLAARHFKNHYIPEDQCYHCHTDYGLGGDMEAKLTGFRHLARYTTRTYHEPIAGRTPYQNQNCLKCHEGAPSFERVVNHTTARALLRSSAMSCLNCHGNAHPTRAARTPGSADYERLLGRAP